MAMFSTSLWAADPSFPTECLELPTSSSYMDALEYNNSGYSYNYYLSASTDTLILNNYLIYQSSVSNSKKIKWMTYGGKGSSGADWNADFGFKGKNYWNVNSQANVRSDRVGWYRIKGASKFIALYNQSGSSKKCIVSAYEITYDGDTPSKSAKASVTNTKESSSADTIQLILDSSKEYIIEITGSSTSGYRMPEIMFIAPVCTAPETALALDLSKSSDVYVGDNITLGYAGGNGSSVSYKLDGSAYTEATWTATLGQHTFIVLQDEAEVNSELKCGGSDTLVLNVAAATPVSTCEISGKTSAFIDDEITYTATAANATTFAWYLDDELQVGETSNKFVYTANKGSHTIYATATNAYTTTPIKSNEINLSVTKIYGEIIKAVHTGDKTANVTGIIGGSVDKNTQAGGKLGSADHYFGIHLAEGNFMPYDTIIITATNVSAFVEIFSTKTFSSAEDSVNYIDHGTFDANKVYKYVLTSSYEWIYLYRTKTSTTNMNPTLGSIAVHRPLKYDVVFAAGEGSGSMSTLEYPATVQVTLPACSFTAPEDKTFDAWTTSDATITDGKFAMPAKDVTITATWKDAGGETALDNVEESASAIKRIENGQLIIEKNGVRYNAMGQIIR